jgi:hypothetical protein
VMLLGACAEVSFFVGSDMSRFIPAAIACKSSSSSLMEQDLIFSGRKGCGSGLDVCGRSVSSSVCSGCSSTEPNCATALETFARFSDSLCVDARVSGPLRGSMTKRSSMPSCCTTAVRPESLNTSDVGTGFDPLAVLESFLG